MNVPEDVCVLADKQRGDSFSYQLTPVGASMSHLHICDEVTATLLNLSICATFTADILCSFE